MNTDDDRELFLTFVTMKLNGHILDVVSKINPPYWTHYKNAILKQNEKSTLNSKYIIIKLSKTTQNTSETISEFGGRIQQA